VGLAKGAHLSRHHLASGVKLGILERSLPRVYRVVGLQKTRLQEIAAAQLWAEPDAAISHWTAIELHELELPRFDEIHLTTTRWVEAPSSVIVVHPRSFLRAGDICRIDGLAVSEPMRTLIDLAAVAKPFLWESALDAFIRQGMELAAFMDRFDATAIQGRNGTRLIRNVLKARETEAGVPEQLFERKFLNLLRDHGVEPPQCQYWVDLTDGRRIRLDFAYPQQRIAIEAQSFGWHSERTAWERDRDRLSELTSLCWRVIEVTWRQLNETPKKVVEQVLRTLRSHPS
jgi:hypothetical protein